MGRPVADDIKLALEQEEVSTRLLLEIYLRASDIPTVTLNTISTVFSVENGFVVFRFVANDTDSLTIPDTCDNTAFAGKKYICAEIERGDIETSTDGQVEKTTIKMSNRWQTYAAIFANLGNIMNNRRCVLYEYFPDFPEEAPVNIFDGVMNGVKMTATQFEWELRRSVVDFDANSPNMTYDVNCQWTFADGKYCPYQDGVYGAYSKCDKTMEQCIARGMILYFGGHPSVPREMVIRSR